MGRHVLALAGLSCAPFGGSHPRVGGHPDQRFGRLERMFGERARRRDVVVVSEPGPGTDELILDEARRAEASLLALHNNLDQKAGVLQGFAGVLVTLLAGTSTVATWPRVMAASIAATAALIAAVPIGSRPPGLLAPIVLIRDGVADRPRADAVEIVTNGVAFLALDSDEKLRRKNLRVRTAAVLLGIAVAVVVLGLIVEFGGGPVSSSPNPQWGRSWV